MLEVRLLGTFELQRNGKSIVISSRPAQSLFAYLILHPGTPHRREKLAGMLWPDSLEEIARDNLRHALWRVRKALQSASAASYLQANDLTISFNSSIDYWFDVAELEKLSESASADELIAVLSEYRGEFLPGFYDEWAVLEREHLDSLFGHHMARLMSRLRDENRWLDMLEWGERWIKLGQRPEPAYRALMLAHAAKGDMSKVAGTYERCVKSFKEIGVEPSEQTRTLYERLKTGKEKLEARTVIPLPEKRKASVSPLSNLPVPLTSFIGREEEVERVIRLLEKNRLVTLTGSGGVGKTRLAIQVSNKLLSKFKDGVWWTELAGLNDPLLISQTVAQVVNVREIPNQSLVETLIESLQTKHTLLVLDNCEHLIMGCAQLADRLLSTCPNLKILATSREGLGLVGESLWNVLALSSPDPDNISLTQLSTQYESIRLFAERATAVKPDFALTERNALAIARVCHRLDGIPLAIELAAARVKVLSVEQIADRLDDRFDLLTGGSRAAFPRHQTLRAAMDWGYDLLPDEERALFRRLAVFAGGWTLQAAQSICSGDGIDSTAVLDLLMHLVDKSLVIMEEYDGEARYRMLETIRQYARQKLSQSGETIRVQHRHLDFYRKLAEEIEPRLHGAQQALSLKSLDLEHDNLRAALDWSLTGGDLEAGFRLAGGLWLFWDIYGYQLEGRVWLDRLLARCHGLEPAPSDAAQARVYYVAAHLRQRQGDLERARKLYGASLALYRQLEAPIQVAVVLRGLGEIAQDKGDLPGARDYYEQSLSLLRSLGDKKETSIALDHLAIIALLENNYEQATVLCKQTLAIGRERGDNRSIAIALTILGFASWGQGELERAALQFNQSLALQAELSDKRMVQYSLMGMALVALTTGQPARAARLLGAADSLRKMIGTPLPPSQRPRYDKLVESIRGQLDEAAFERAWAAGRALTMEQALDFALKETQV